MNFSIGYQNTIYLQVFKALMAFVFVIQIDIGMKEKIDHGNSRKQWPAAIIPLVIITETIKKHLEMWKMVQLSLILIKLNL